MASCGGSKLYRKRQVLGKIQTKCDVPALLSADDGKLRVDVGQDATPEVNQNERNIASAYLSKRPNVPGAVMGKMSFTSEIVGSGSLSNPPEHDAYLRGCGMSRINLNYLTVASLAGAKALATDEIITGATSGATGRIAAPWAADTTKVFFELVSGTFQDGEQINGSIAGDSAFETDGAASSGGFMYLPSSGNYETLTIRSEEDGYVKNMINAMGTVSLSAEASSIGKFEFEFTGAVDKKAYRASCTGTLPTGVEDTDTLLTTATNKSARYWGMLDASTIILVPVSGDLANGDVFSGDVNVTDPDTGVVTSSAVSVTLSSDPKLAYFGDADMTSGIEQYTTIPAILQDSNTKWSETFSPVFGSVSFDVGNTVTMTVDANDHRGLRNARITERNPSGSIDPHMTSAEDFDFYDGFFNGNLYPLQCRFGTEEGNTCWVIAPKIQPQTVSDSDKDGDAGLSYEFEAKGIANDEFKLVFI